MPRMPRHNLPAVAPRVQALLRKHGVHVTHKPLFGAFGSVLVSLEDAVRHWNAQTASSKKKHA
jgi:hypothetical protein